MPKRISSLTDAQKARMESWTKEWIDIGLCTKPADRPRFEKAIRDCYSFANLKNDIPIIWVSSPIVGALAASIARYILQDKKINSSAVGLAVGSAVDSAVHSAVHSAVGSAVDSAVYSAVYSAVRSAVGSAVHSAVYSAVHSAVRSAVYSAVHSAVRSAVVSAVGSAVDSAVRSAVYSAVRSAVDSAVYSAVYSAVRSAVGSAVDSAVDSKKLNWHSWLGGSLWSYWPSYTEFFFKVCKLDLGEINLRSEAYAELAISGCYSWPNINFIMTCERPNKILKDSRGRLHCEDSKAITWPDGWGLFMWHGTRVPAKLIINPNAITKEEILNEKNSEVSRAYAERLGWERYFKLTDVEKIDAWLDDNTGLHYELYDFNQRKGRFQPRLLRMESPKLKDGSMPVYIEPVPPEIQTAKAARRWQFQKEDGTWPSVEESNREPDLVFGWEA